MRQLISFGRMVSRSNGTLQLSKTSKRFSSHYVGYRELNYEPGRKFQKVYSEVLAGFMWWWIGWNIMTDWRHLIGEFIWPQRSEWTNAELGIPED